MKRRAVTLAGVTPLLDTLFLLLFSLLVVSDTKQSTRTEAVHIQLPEVEPGSSPTPGSAVRFALAIDANSRLFEAETGTLIESRDELDQRLAERVGDRLPEELVIEISADRDSRSGIALELLQHLLLRGFVRVELVALGNESDPGAPFGAEPR